ncbi:MAG TPA: hypothetical protein VGW38_17600, partial [Chloroflexota bacterium]|nr:hypothetical protein [Chloroflexota bacterium]
MNGAQWLLAGGDRCHCAGSGRGNSAGGLTNDLRAEYPTRRVENDLDYHTQSVSWGSRRRGVFRVPTTMVLSGSLGGGVPDGPRGLSVSQVLHRPAIRQDSLV